MSPEVILGTLILFNVILAIFFNRVILEGTAPRRATIIAWIVSGLAYAALLAWSVHNSDTRSSFLAAAGLAASAITALGAVRWRTGKRFPATSEILVGWTSERGKRVGRLFSYILSMTLTIAALSFLLEPNLDVRYLFERAAFAGAILGLLLYASEERATDSKS